MVEGVVTALEDVFPIMRKRKKIFLAGTAILLFLIGIPMVMQVEFNEIINQNVKIKK
jgi:hypothetical protein